MTEQPNRPAPADPWADWTDEDAERVKREHAEARARVAKYPKRTPPRDPRTGEILSH